jgi:hypothetical protein
VGAEAKAVDNRVKAAVLQLLALLLTATSVSGASCAARLQAAQLLRICLDELHRHILSAVIQLLPAHGQAASGALATAL